MNCVNKLKMLVVIALVLSLSACANVNGNSDAEYTQQDIGPWGGINVRTSREMLDAIEAHQNGPNSESMLYLNIPENLYRNAYTITIPASMNVTIRCQNDLIGKSQHGRNPPSPDTFVGAGCRLTTTTWSFNMHFEIAGALTLHRVHVHHDPSFVFFGSNESSGGFRQTGRNASLRMYGGEISGFMRDVPGLSIIRSNRFTRLHRVRFNNNNAPLTQLGTLELIPLPEN